MLSRLATSRSSLQPAAARAGFGLLTDHFDAVLRHGEALSALERPVVVSAFDGLKVGALIRRNREDDGVAQDARALELAIVLRLQQAHLILDRAGRSLPERASLLRLIASATEVFAGFDPTAEVGPSTAFFESRGLAAAVSAPTPLGEAYRVCGLLELGTLMDAVAAALDLLDSVDRIDGR